MYPKVSSPKRLSAVNSEVNAHYLSNSALLSPRHEFNSHLPKYKARRKKLSQLFQLTSTAAKPKRYHFKYSDPPQDDLKREINSLTVSSPPPLTTPDESQEGEMINISDIKIPYDRSYDSQESFLKQGEVSRLSFYEEKKSKLPRRKISINSDVVALKHPPSMIQVLFQSGKKVVSKIPVPKNLISAYKESKKTPTKAEPKNRKKAQGKSPVKPRVDSNNNSNGIKGCISRSSSNKMGNKPTRIKDRSYSVDKSSEKTTKKKLKLEEQARNDSKWKPGRGKKTAKKDKKAPVTTVPSGYLTPSNSSEALLKSAILTILPNNQIYSDNNDILNAFHDLVTEWKSEYYQKSLATEALAVVVKHLNLKAQNEKDSFSNSFCNAEKQELQYCEEMISLIRGEDMHADDTNVDVHKQLENAIIQIKTENTELKKKIETIQLRASPPSSPNGDLPSQCSKCKDVSAEIESLQIVLDMKAKEVQKLNVERMKLLQKFEKYYEIEKRYETLSREREAMAVLLESKSKFERQLSVERDTLAVDLEKKSRIVAQLSMEKEELLWKASNNSRGSSSPDVSSHRLSHPPSFSFMSSSPVVNSSEKPLKSPSHCSFTIQEN